MYKWLLIPALGCCIISAAASFYSGHGFPYACRGKMRGYEEMKLETAPKPAGLDTKVEEKGNITTYLADKKELKEIVESAKKERKCSSKIHSSSNSRRSNSCSIKSSCCLCAKKRCAKTS